ncbi:N-terminal acetyltransferase complex catalytic [Salix suchowensis]|nr:N-terminal acetyltransferase complex catalytic [Salix suchowensis]
MATIDRKENSSPNFLRVHYPDPHHDGPDKQGGVVNSWTRGCGRHRRGWKVCNGFLPGDRCVRTTVSREAKKVYKICNLTDEEATLVEPAACAIHGMDRLNAAVGIDALIIGAGPTGLILAQLLKLNGAAKVVIAANKGIKTQVAKDLDAGDAYIELDRDNPGPQWQQLKEDNPYGFDVVIEATGSAGVANEAINFVRRGGTLMIYGVYANDALVHWSPAQVTDIFKLEDYDKVLEKMKDKSAVKIAVRPT